jgi:hypothetical protein
VRGHLLVSNLYLLLLKPVLWWRTLTTTFCLSFNDLEIFMDMLSSLDSLLYIVPTVKYAFSLIQSFLKMCTVLFGMYKTYALWALKTCTYNLEKRTHFPLFGEKKTSKIM